jgi:hypothetical protein
MPLSPATEARLRCAAEDDALLLRRTEATVRRLTRESLPSGRERRDAVAGATPGVLVRAGEVLGSPLRTCIIAVPTEGNGRLRLRGLLG